MAAPGSTYKYLPLNSDASNSHFRVLILSPGQSEEPLYCDIQQASLIEPPDYEALSYTWGDPKGIHCLVPCQGDITATFYILVGEDRSYLRIGYNLMCALKQLRHKNEPKTLWIDAICINQGDDEEKSWQVACMARIFSLASRVLAWLGEDDQFVNLAFDTVEELCWATKASFWGYCSKKLGLPIEAVTEEQITSFMHHERQPKIRTPDSFFAASVIPRTEQIMEAFHLTPPFRIDGASLIDSAAAQFGSSRVFAQYLVSNGSLHAQVVGLSERYSAVYQIFSDKSYWRRLWIVQEFLNAKSVIILCGNREMNMHQIYLIQLALVSDGSPSFSVLLPALSKNSPVDFTRSFRKVLDLTIQAAQSPQRSLSDALHFFAWSVCSEMRDNIFALLNISIPIPINVDYHADIADVFLETTKAIIKQEQSIDIIFRKPRSDQADCSTWEAKIVLPSWTPKFHTRLDSLLFGFYSSLSSVSLYCAGGPMRPDHIGIDPGDPRILRSYGIFSGNVVRRAFTVFPPRAGQTSLWETILGIMKELDLNNGLKSRTLGRRDRTCKAMIEPPFQTSRASIFWDTLVAGVYPNPSASGNPGRLSHNSDLEEKFRIAIKAACEDSGGSDEIRRRLRRILDIKTLCVLDNDELALVHGDPKIGDLVFVAGGASVPLVVRPVNTSFRVKSIRKERELGTDFSLVGGAYVYGIMDGELIDRYKDSEERWHEVRLV